MNLKLVVVVILLLLVVIFAVQNYEVIEIQFLFWSLRTSIAIIIFVSLVIGFAAGWTLPVLLKRK